MERALGEDADPDEEVHSVGTENVVIEIGNVITEHPIADGTKSDKL